MVNRTFLVDFNRNSLKLYLVCSIALVVSPIPSSIDPSPDYVGENVNDTVLRLPLDLPWRNPICLVIRVEYRECVLRRISLWRTYRRCAYSDQ